MTAALLDRAATSAFACPSFCTNHYDSGNGEWTHWSDRLVKVRDDLEDNSHGLLVDVSQMNDRDGTYGPWVNLLWAACALPSWPAANEAISFLPEAGRRVGRAVLDAIAEGPLFNPVAVVSNYSEADRVEVRWFVGWPDEHASPYVEVVYLVGAAGRDEPVVVQLDEYDARELGEGLIQAADMAVAP